VEARGTGAFLCLFQFIPALWSFNLHIFDVSGNGPRIDFQTGDNGLAYPWSVFSTEAREYDSEMPG
jgi:hypothetical protein